MKNFKLVNYDTDSITFSKADGTVFSQDEQNNLLMELNSLYPDKIKWESDGYFKKVIVLKAKNYVLYDPSNKNPKKHITIKGSALKSSKLELALKEFQRSIINEIINETNNFRDVYVKYIKEAVSIQDISRWASKKTITEKVFQSERANEKKILDALKGTEFSEGDKVWVYFKSDETLSLVGNFDGDYHKDKMLEKIYKTAQIFKNILPVDDVFPNLKLKKNKKLLEQILNG